MKLFSEMSILTLTMNPSVDKSSAVERVEANRKLRCGEPEVDPGGGGLNVSRVVLELGGETTAVYTSGGYTGRLLDDLLEEAGIPARSVRIEGETREDLTITDAESEDQYRFVMPGPPLRRTEWEECLEATVGLLKGARYVVASGSLPPDVPPDFYGRLARGVKAEGCRLVVDTSGKALRAAGEEGAFLFKPNRKEIEVLVGREVGDEEAGRHALEEFVAEGSAEAVVWSLGKEGALLVHREGTESLPVPDVPVKSRIGAGDSTVAGIVFALDEGRPLEEAVTLGLAAGAAAVMTRGTKLCRRGDVEDLFHEMRGGLVR